VLRAACLQTAGDKCRDFPGGKTAAGGAEDVSLATDTVQDTAGAVSKKKCALPVHPKLLNTGAALEMKPLWDEFNELGTEMIVTKAGRSVSVFTALCLLFSLPFIIFFFVSFIFFSFFVASLLPQSAPFPSFSHFIFLSSLLLFLLTFHLFSVCLFL
jgi:hypothetical protein